MASAEAKKYNEETGYRVVFGNGEKMFWNEIFNGNPRIAKEPKDGETICWVGNFPGCRPYIKEITETNLIFEPGFKPEPGEIYLSPKEKKKPLPRYVVIEPNVKTNWYPGMNKDWGWDNWQKLVRSMTVPWVQLGAKDARTLKGVHRVYTEDIRSAIGVLAGADLLVSTDGALHHAAAAMGVPAVVLWGGLASPKNLGYDAHTNIWHGAEPCGSFRKVCEHCQDAMAQISVDEVKTEIARILEAR
jgi:ADP-heptose:LPS heptosyltransferase